ncbi:MAG: RMD1 family protein [Campylobacterales bacterium]
MQQAAIASCFVADDAELKLQQEGFALLPISEEGRLYAHQHQMAYIGIPGVVVLWPDPVALAKRLGWVVHDTIEISYNHRCTEWAIADGKLCLRDNSPQMLLVAAIALARSAGLDKCERESRHLWHLGNKLLSQLESSRLLRQRLLYHLFWRIATLRYDLHVRLLVLDKPETTWESDEADRLYRALSQWLELDSRFESLEKKLSLLHDEGTIVMRLSYHFKAEFQSILIILLILLAIIIESLHLGGAS